MDGTVPFWKFPSLKSFIKEMRREQNGVESLALQKTHLFPCVPIAILEMDKFA